jgi:hypothetical protein
LKAKLLKRKTAREIELEKVIQQALHYIKTNQTEASKNLLYQTVVDFGIYELNPDCWTEYRMESYLKYVATTPALIRALNELWDSLPEDERDTDGSPSEKDCKGFSGRYDRIKCRWTGDCFIANALKEATNDFKTGANLTIMQKKILKELMIKYRKQLTRLANQRKQNEYTYKPNY